MKKVSRLVVYCLLASTSLLQGQDADLRLLQHLNSGYKPTWDRGMKGFTQSAYPVGIVTPIGIWAHGRLKKDKAMMRNGYKSVVCIGLAMGISTGLKYLVRRERPSSAHPAEIIARDHSGTYSFPSGHTTAAFASATSLSLSYKKWYVAVPAYAYAGLMGYSRMRLGVHYPSDVLGGIITGIGSGLLTWKLDHLIFGK